LHEVRVVVPEYVLERATEEELRVLNEVVREEDAVIGSHNLGGLPRVMEWGLDRLKELLGEKAQWLV